MDPWHGPTKTTPHGRRACWPATTPPLCRCAPALPLRLDAECVDGSEALLAFGAQPLSGAAQTINLSPTGDLTEAAANLFAALHDLDRAGFSAIAVMPMPEGGLGHAINDRLQRAAAPRNGSQAAPLRRAGQP